MSKLEIVVSQKVRFWGILGFWEGFGSGAASSVLERDSRLVIRTWTLLKEGFATPRLAFHRRRLFGVLRVGLWERGSEFCKEVDHIKAFAVVK